MGDILYLALDIECCDVGGGVDVVDIGDGADEEGMLISSIDGKCCVVLLTEFEPAHTE